FGFLGVLRGGDNRTELSGCDHADHVYEVALPGSRRAGPHEVNRGGRQRSAKQSSQQSGECNRTIEPLVQSISLPVLEGKLAEQVLELFERSLCILSRGALSDRRHLQAGEQIELRARIVSGAG